MLIFFLENKTLVEFDTSPDLIEVSGEHTSKSNFLVGLEHIQVIEDGKHMNLCIFEKFRTILLKVNLFCQVTIL